MGYKMDIKVKYAGITKRAAAYIVDQIIFLVCYSLFYLLILFILSGEPLADVFNYVFPDIDTNSDLISERYEILEDLDILLKDLVYIALEVLMITRLGWTGFVASHLILVVIYDKYHVAISNLAIPISVN
ncbi:hypothetical protein [Wolbachia endosymbiont (group A) of Bibio marci]|uniref:hypothetical protein n=1 Tax=Wolbachia endosymbiont (group A) of Bibio marci TaxID=2953987 RepID=UPI002231E521|nr:hypothetical protein [Wolbachia endosymbiont (group A) of Bibio marci]